MKSLKQLSVIGICGHCVDGVGGSSSHGTNNNRRYGGTFRRLHVSIRAKHKHRVRQRYGQRPHRLNGDGSEIDQLFGKVENGRLYLVVAGNLQDNFNKLEIFLDTDPNAGVNQIISNPANPTFDPNDAVPVNDPNSNVPYGLDRFCCGGFTPPDGGNNTNEGGLQRHDFMAFDAGFTADHIFTFSHGGENVGSGGANIGFWAMNAHYADLTQGVDGDVVAAGIALAPSGLPNLLRGPLPPDFNLSTNTDGLDFLIWQQNEGQFIPDPNTGFDPNTNPGAVRSQGDANDDQLVNGADLAIWEIDYGNKPSLTSAPFTPNSGIISTSSLIGPALPGLGQGQLIDKVYAMDPNGGGCTDDAGTGCVARELEFVLPVDAANNPNNHRNFENTIGLEAAINNSNTGGVDGNDPNGSGMWEATGNPGDVRTGIEFSIGLDELGLDPNFTGDIGIAGFINGSNFDFASNQFIGGVLQNNLGGDGSGGFTGGLDGVDLSTIAGDQFVTLTVAPAPSVSAVPEPTALCLMVLASSVGCMYRRK